jgi:AraC-like DNA-binding protein
VSAGGLTGQRGREVVVPAITRGRTVLRDADEAYDFIDRAYARVRARSVGLVGSPALVFRSAATPLLKVDLVSNRMPTRHSVQLQGDCAFALCVAGGWAYDAGRAGSGAMVPGTPVAYPDDRPLTVEWAPFEALTLRLPRAEFARVAQEYGRSTRPFRFTGMSPLSDGLSSYWAGIMRHHAREVMATDSSLTSPLVHQAAIDAIAAGALASFPNTATTDSVRGTGRFGRDRVQQAEEFIHAHASLPVTLSQIAAEAGCSPWQLRAAFQSRWGMSPMRYLREVRLDLAHHELDSLGPGAPGVAEVARRWGLAHTGRFRPALRRRYGQDPANRPGPRGRLP